MKRKIYKGGVDNYPLWWYGQNNRLQNFGDRTNFLTPHGAVFKGNGYYFNKDNFDYMEDIYGRHLIRKGTNGVWHQLYLTDSAVPPCGSVVGTGDRLILSNDGKEPKITGELVLLQKYCPNLWITNCANNMISKLSILSNKVTYLSCSHNQLLELDTSAIKGSYQIICDYNQLLTLDVSGMVKLVEFDCSYNQLPLLDVSADSRISTLNCNNNLFDSAMVDTILCDANSWNTSNGILDISGNTAPSQTGVDAKNDMVNRNWTVTTD